MTTSKHYAEVADFLIKVKRYSEAERAIRAAQNHVDWTHPEAMQVWKSLQHKLIGVCQALM